MAIDPFSAGTLVLLVGVFLGAFVAGFAGFGLAAAAGAFLLHVLEPKLAVPLMMICSVCAQSVGLVFLRKSINAASAWPSICGGIVGVPIAIMMLREIDGGALRTGFGAFLVAYASWALMSLYGVTARMLAKRPATPGGPDMVQPAVQAASPRFRGKALVGIVAGIVGGLTAMPGAVLSIWSDTHRLPKAEQRGFVQPFILSMQITALGLMLLTPGLLTREILPLLYASLVPLILGTLLGLYLYGRASAKGFRVGVLAIVLASGCGLVVQ